MLDSDANSPGWNAYASKGSRMFPGKTVLLLGLGLSLCLATLAATAAGVLKPAADFPLSADSYHDQQIPSVFTKLTGRIQREPLNLVATIIFFGAVVHTFLAARFRKIAHNYQQSYEAIEYLLHATDGPPDFGKKHDKLLFRAQLFYFMGEVEAVFGVWLIPLFLAIIAFQGWSTMVDYVGNVNVADAIFVVVIMAMASSLPIIRFTETVIAKVSAIGSGTPASWWLTILTLGPLLGSFITGPAAMTICALLLRHRFYSLKPSEPLKYATLGLLFVNISVGGVLTQFASPPVVIVASAWNWDLVYMLSQFRLESCHRYHLVQFALSHGISERIRQTQGQRSRRRTRSRGAPANSVADHGHPSPLSLLDSSERSLSCACDLGSSFLSGVRLSYAAEPARDRTAATVTCRLLPCSPNHSRRLPAMVDRACSRELE